MTYTAYYKKVGSFRWNKVNNVKGDLVAMDMPNSPRVLILEDETRIEIPVEGMMFKFSSGRFLMIKKNMEKESGQDIKV